jgi:paraquat-inducible protein B
MSKPANKTLIGIFILGAIGLLVIAIVVLGSGKFFRQTFKAVCYFEGSVGGLNVGAPVVFRGVKIGSVTRVVLRFEPNKLIFVIPVYIEIEPNKIEAVGPVPKKLGENLKAMIDRGLRARLETQSIVTGQMQVGLDFYPDKPVKFTEFRIDASTPEIPTIPSPLQELAKKISELPLEEIVRDIASAVKGINRVVNSPEIAQTLRSISQAADETRQLVHDMKAKTGPLLSSLEGAVNGTQKLAGDVQKLAQNVNDQVQPLSASAQETLKEGRRLLRGLDEKTTTLTSRIDEALKDAQSLVRNADGQIGPVATSLRSTLASIEKTSEEAGVTLRQAQQTLKSVEGEAGGESELIYEFNQALRDVRALAKAIRDLADTLDRQPESAIFGKKNPTRR